jgi:hypothetical protein
MIQFNAQFDGKNLCPEEPVSLPENVTLRVMIAEPVAHEQAASGKAIDVFDSLERQTGLIEGPADWSAEHDHYLYGVPKHGNGTDE